MTVSLPARKGWMAGLAFAVISVLIFSGWFVVTRFTVTHHLRIWDVTALRFGGGAVLLAPVLFRQHLPAAAWREGVLYALLWGAPFVLLVAAGLQLTTAAQASSVVPALMPIMAGMMVWGVSGKRPSALAMASYAAILAGLIVLVASRQTAAGSFSFAGYGALALAAFVWAIYSVRIRSSSLSALQAASLICFWSALVFIPVYLACGLSRLDQASAQEIAFQLIYQGGLMSGVALITYNRAVAMLGTGAAAAMMALVPVLATVLAIPVLGEIPSTVGMIAIAVIAVGVAMAARPPARAAAMPEHPRPLPLPERNIR